MIWTLSSRELLRSQVSIRIALYIYLATLSHRQIIELLNVSLHKAESFTSRIELVVLLQGEATTGVKTSASSRERIQSWLVEDGRRGQHAPRE